MSSRDRTYRPPSSGTESDTPPETSCSQVSMASVGTPRTPSISQSLGKFTFASPIPSPSPRVRRPKRKIYRFSGNQFGKMKTEKPKKFAKVVTTSPKSVRVPSSSTATSASRKLDFPIHTFLPTQINIKCRSPDGKVEAEDVLPVTGNCVINVESFISILGEVAACRNCQLGILELYQKSYHLSCATQLMFRCKKCFACRTFWSVSGYFRSSIQLGDNIISKRNDIMYSTVLGGRLAGIGQTSMRLYHAAMNIPPPPVGTSFQNIQRISYLLVNTWPTIL